MTGTSLFYLDLNEMRNFFVDCGQDDFVLALVIQFLLTSNDLRKQALNGNVLDVCSHAIKSCYSSRTFPMASMV